MLFTDFSDVVEMRYRRIRIDRRAHQPTQLHQIGDHSERPRKVVFRPPVSPRTVMDLHLRHPSSELARNRREVSVHARPKLEWLDYRRAVDLQRTAIVMKADTGHDAEQPIRRR